MLRRRTTKLTAEYVGRYNRSPDGTGLDAADVHARMRELLNDVKSRGALGPTASARTLRDAAAVLDTVVADCLERIARIDAEYGEVFRRVEYVSGKYVDAYRALLAQRALLQHARQLAPRLRSLAKRYERRAVVRRLLAGTSAIRPDITALEEIPDTGALLRALDHRHEGVRVRAAAALGRLRATEAVERLLAVLGDRQPCADPPSRQLREAVIGALGAIGDRRAVEPLIRYAREHLHDREDVPALAALVQIGDGRAGEVLAAHLWHGHLPNGAASLLADLGDPSAIPVLRDYIAGLEGSEPGEGAERRLRDLDLKAARTALARLESDARGRARGTSAE
jgi:HEAT repeat protein